MRGQAIIQSLKLKTEFAQQLAGAAVIDEEDEVDGVSGPAQQNVRKLKN
jgi:hypothetical protein